MADPRTIRRRATAFFWAATATYVACVVWAALTLPDVVATHFDGAGRADDHSTRGEAIALWSGLGVFVLGGGWLLARFPPQSREWVNMREEWKDHWLEDADRRRDYQRIAGGALLELTAATGILLAVLVVVTSHATTTGSGVGPALWASLVAYGACTVWRCVVLVRDLRPPEDPTDAEGAGSSSPQPH